MEQKIILASASKQRKLIMDVFGVPYVVIPADADEKSIRDSDYAIRAEKIARLKAEIVAKENDGIIIAADSFVVCNGKVLEKPENNDEAKEMLKLQMENQSVVYTGFCYIDKKNKIDFSTTSVSRFNLRQITDQEINHFVNNNNVLQWSGAISPLYLYQTTFLKYLEGSFTGLNGLPTDLLIDCFIKSGVKTNGS
ncbi:MAG: Maf family protein [Candidatus Shapirobacteria bacterium]